MNIHHNHKIKFPDAVMIDTDDTLYDYKSIHPIAMKAVAKKVEKMYGINNKIFFEVFSTARKQVKQQLGNTASSHSRLLYMQRVLELLGLKSQIINALDMEQTYWRTLLQNAQLFEGVKDFLDELKLRKIPITIVTDLTSQIQFRKVVFFQLENHIDYIVTSEEAGHDKPHPAPFKLALQKMNIKTGNIWMIGDNPLNDIQGAKKSVGATTFLLKNTKNTSDIKPDVCFKKFSDLINILRKLDV